MILPIHQRIREALTHTLARLYQIPGDTLNLQIEYAPSRDLGDLATPAAFELARRLRKAPRVIAQAIASAIGPLEGVSRIEATGNGYLNIYLDRATFLKSALGRPAAADPAASVRRDGKVI